VVGLVIVYLLWLCRNGKVLIIKVLLPCSLSIGAPICFVHGFFGESRPVFRGAYTVGGHIKKYFYLTWMVA
jgi:hypothetical protein